MDDINLERQGASPVACLSESSIGRMNFDEFSAYAERYILMYIGVFICQIPPLRLSIG
jgi:hypothetical protein